MKSSWLGTVLALLPLLWILWGLGWKRWRSVVVTPVALGITLAVAIVYWRQSPLESSRAVLEGITLGIWPIFWTILAAVYTYKVGLATGAVAELQQSMLGVSSDHRVQAILITFALGGFLEAVAGFGSAVAIPTGILISLGFQPLTAVTVSLVANTIPVAFGALGILIITLAQLTGLNTNQLTLTVAGQLLPLVILLPAFLVYLAVGRTAGLRGMVTISLAAGLGFGLGQTAVGYFLGPELAAIAGSLGAFLAVWLFTRGGRPREIWQADPEQVVAPKPPHTVGEALRPWWPYILVLVLVMATRLLPFLQFLRKPPFVTELVFYPGGKPTGIDWLTAPGTLLFISAAIGGFLQGATVGVLRRELVQTIRQLTPTFITVISIVALAKVMGHSGMVAVIATTLSGLAGRFFPFFAPVLGALGTFLTGSDTSANVLFGPLQHETALRLGLSPTWLAAANTSGATAGKMISPQSIAIAAAAAGLTGEEGTILRRTLVYCLLYVGIIGLMVWVGSLL